MASGGTAGAAGTIGSGGTSGGTGGAGTAGTGGTNAGAGGAGTGGAGGGRAGTAGSAGAAGSSAATAGCGKATWPTTNDQSGSTPYTVMINGMAREYYVSVPADYDSGRATRVVFAWHWRGGNARNITGNGGFGGAYYGLKSRITDAIYIAPEGLSVLGLELACVRGTFLANHAARGQPDAQRQHRKAR